MAQPSTSRVAAQVYREALPLAYEDEARGWPLLHYVEGSGSTLAEIEELAYDSDDGPGWSAALDLDRAPERILDWLAQVNGVPPRDDLAEDAYRTFIFDAAGRRRGRPASLIAAGQLHLTGTKTVIVNERTTSAYAFEVVTYIEETPDADETYADLLSQKPAGLVMTHTLQSQWTYGDAADAYSGQTYADLAADYDDYSELKTNTP